MVGTKTMLDHSASPPMVGVQSAVYRQNLCHSVVDCHCGRGVVDGEQQAMMEKIGMKISSREAVEMMWEADEDRAGARREGLMPCVCRWKGWQHFTGRLSSTRFCLCRAGGALAVQDFVDLYFRVSTDVTGNEPRRLYNLLEFLLFSVR